VNPGANLRLGRKTRKISAALRRALRLRDTGCQFPGCPRRKFLDAHHVAQWADGGPTDLANLILLCGRHHRAVHEDGFTLVPDPNTPQRWMFHRPDGTPVPTVPHGEPEPEDVSAETARQYPPDSLRPQQHGETFSLRDSVDVFCRNTRPDPTPS
ncbi:MAG TPA: HNH endonuclease signature motif containing protein, partial [Nakamurella sp.]